MDLDDHVCLCFRVSKRKLIRFVERHRPAVPSQMSACGGAGTGCGWCIPFLKVIFRQNSTGPMELDGISAAEYAVRRAVYLREGKGVPPAATPPPADEG